MYCQAEVSATSWSLVQRILPSVVCRVWSRNLANEEAMDHWRVWLQKPTKRVCGNQVKLRNWNLRLLSSIFILRSVMTTQRWHMRLSSVESENPSRTLIIMKETSKDILFYLSALSGIPLFLLLLRFSFLSSFFPKLSLLIFTNFSSACFHSWIVSLQLCLLSTLPLLPLKLSLSFLPLLIILCLHLPHLLLLPLVLSFFLSPTLPLFTL
jgi:hypothetical protein